MPDISVGIFCRTYEKDADRLEYMLRSIEKFCDGFDQVVVATPAASMASISPVVGRFKFAELKECVATRFDFIGQQVTKLTANRFISSDVILHLDSDCIFTRKTSPCNLLRDGKPVLYFAPYSYFYEHGENMPWQTVTSSFLRRQVDFEFMRMFPLVYPRELYLDLQTWYQEVYEEPIDDIHLKIQGDYFSEFNLMGAFSYYSDPNYHNYVDVLTEAPDIRVRQFCLFSSREDRSIAGDERDEIDRLLGDGAGRVDFGSVKPQVDGSTEQSADMGTIVPMTPELNASPASSTAASEPDGAALGEMAAFKAAELWDGGFVDADPLLPLSWSSYSTTGFVSIYQATYLACIKPYVHQGDQVMEIGPGRGIWTRALICRGAEKVYTLDVQSRETNSIDQVLGNDADKLEYIVVSDFEGEGVPDVGIDFFWSFGTFVHLSRTAQAAYLRTIQRKLKPGAYGFIQFADFDVWNKVVSDRSLHIHEVLADRLGGEEGERVREVMSASPVIAAREALPEAIRDDDRIHPGRYFYVGTEWLAAEIEAAGMDVIDRNVFENLRDPIIQFRKPSGSVRRL